MYQARRAALEDGLSDGMATHFSERIRTKMGSPVGVRSDGCARDCSTTSPTLTWKSRYSPRKSLAWTVARMMLSLSTPVGSCSDSSTSSGRTDTMAVLFLATPSPACALMPPSAEETTQRPLLPSAEVTVPPMKFVLPTKSATNWFLGVS